jgi:emfourin
MGDRPFRIDLTRTGGFGGLRLHGSVDVGTLPPEQAAALTDLVDGVDFAALEGQPVQKAWPDEFRYDLTIIRGDRHHHLIMGDRSVPPELRALLSRLVELAGPR